MVTEMTQRTGALMKVMQRFQPDVMTGIMGPSIALAGKLRQVPSVVFYDTEFARQTNWFVYPLAHSVVTPDCYQGKVRGTQRTLRRLPRARVPPPEPVHAGPGEARARSACRAGRAVLDRALRLLAGRARPQRDGAHRRRRSATWSRRSASTAGCSISSEATCRPTSRAYEVKGPVEDIHHLLAHAQMIVGESATMSSEAAVLGRARR